MQYEINSFTEPARDEDWRTAVHEAGHAVVAAFGRGAHEAKAHIATPPLMTIVEIVGILLLRQCQMPALNTRHFST